MKKNCGSNAEKFLKLFNARNVLRYKVFADDGGNGGEGGNSQPANNGGDDGQPTINYEQLIAKAREEEKNKLYPQITKLKEEKADLVKKNNEYLLKIGTLDQTIEKLNKKIETLTAQQDGNESEVVKSLKDQLASANKELDDLKKSTPNVDELTQKIRDEVTAEYEVKFYREKKINEAGGKIIPELVTGTTNEEIDASYEKAVARYNEIVGSAQTKPPVNPTGLNGGNPVSKPAQVTEDAMKAFLELDPASPEYAEARKKFGFH